MHRVTVFLLAATAILTIADAAGQYYVPRAYYTIDEDGHASAPVPLRRLRRSLSPYPYGYGGGANANANAEANAYSDGNVANANANAKADARASSGSWALPIGSGFGASKPLVSGQSVRQSGPVLGAGSVSAGSSVGLDSSGAGYYDQYASASN